MQIYTQGDHYLARGGKKKKQAMCAPGIDLKEKHVHMTIDCERVQWFAAFDHMGSQTGNVQAIHTMLSFLSPFPRFDRIEM